MTTTQPQLTPAQRAELEAAYRHAFGLVQTLAAMLGRPSPVVTRDERRKPKDTNYTP